MTCIHTKLGPSEGWPDLAQELDLLCHIIPIIVRIIILNQEVTVRVINLRWVAVRVARPGMFTKHGVNTSYLAQVLELNVV